eukprot:7943140-Lingulodinium_polyedra.AAC.1
MAKRPVESLTTFGPSGVPATVHGAEGAERQDTPRGTVYNPLLQQRFPQGVEVAMSVGPEEEFLEPVHRRFDLNGNRSVELPPRFRLWTEVVWGPFELASVVHPSGPTERATLRVPG